MLFADVRGYTSMAESQSPEHVARLLNRFYAVATHVLSRADAVIDKLVGDEVMALLIPGFAGQDYVEKMARAAEGLLEAVGYGSAREPWLPVGIGLDRGVAFVGNVGTGEVNDFTALGDVVNTAARLQGEAKAGQIVMSERVYQEVSARYPDARPVELALKGKSEPVAARVVEVGAFVPAWPWPATSVEQAMGADEGLSAAEEQAFWHDALVKSQTLHVWLRRAMRMTPSNPRCKFCCGPFAGIGGRVLRLTGYAPSRKNPQFCNRCFERAPMGGIEAEIGILFADVRGYTALAETRSPEEVARLLNRFYAVATDTLCTRDAIIDKLVGDEVMALFLPGVTGPEYLDKMASAAEALLGGVGYGGRGGPWLPLGIGLDFGLAYVGNVGSGEVKDFTAIGDVVNTAARLQAQAQPGQIVLSERVYEHVAGLYPDARPVQLELKGKREPVAARVVDIAAAVAATV